MNSTSMLSAFSFPQQRTLFLDGFSQNASAGRAVDDAYRFLISGSAAVARSLEMNSRSWYATAAVISVLAEIEELGDLEENWDGEGASPISRSTIDAATSFIRNLRGAIHVPSVYPNPNGTLTLSWRWKSGRAELEIGRTRYSWLVVDRSAGKPRKTHCSGDSRKVPNLGMTDLGSAIAHSSSQESKATIGYEMRHEWQEAAFCY